MRSGLHRHRHRHRRRRRPGTVEVAVALAAGRPEDVAGLADVGVTELVVVDSPPEHPADAGPWVEGPAAR